MFGYVGLGRRRENIGLGSLGSMILVGLVLMEGIENIYNQGKKEIIRKR